MVWYYKKLNPSQNFLIFIQKQVNAAEAFCRSIPKIFETSSDPRYAYWQYTADGINHTHKTLNNAIEVKGKRHYFIIKIQLQESHNTASLPNPDHCTEHCELTQPLARRFHGDSMANPNVIRRQEKEVSVYEDLRTF